jgi:hypothetical protein
MVLGFLGLLLKLVSKVHAGAGLETYFSGFGVKLNYIGVFHSCGVAFCTGGCPGNPLVDGTG